MQVAMHEFKSHMAQYVGKAQAGEVIELTSHRKVVARITGIPKSSHSGVAKLLASGVASWQSGKPACDAIELHRAGKLLSAMVLEDRG